MVFKPDNYAKAVRHRVSQDKTTKVLNRISDQHTCLSDTEKLRRRRTLQDDIFSNLNFTLTATYTSTDSDGARYGYRLKEKVQRIEFTFFGASVYYNPDTHGAMSSRSADKLSEEIYLLIMQTPTMQEALKHFEITLDDYTPLKVINAHL